MRLALGAFLFAIAVFAVAVALIVTLVVEAVHVRAGDGGISGTASWYGPGEGVATPWCTWTLRHTKGCGTVLIRADATGREVTAPVIDWCQCYVGTDHERVIDLEWGVVDSLGLDRAAGLYAVTYWRVGGELIPNTAFHR